ncbi:MAG TPA: ribonuclease III domain-containing protein [Trichocoleus sp.]|jgi:ribonuclease-3
MTIEKNLGYFFFDKDLLKRALTTTEYAVEQQNNGQFCEDQDVYIGLGDRLIQTVVTELLIRYGYTSSSEITHWLHELVTLENLAQISRTQEIDIFIKLSTSEKQQKFYDKPEVLAATLQAIVGAIYFDGGFRAAAEVIKLLFQSAFSNE